MTIEASEWLERFAAKLGVAPPTPEEVELLLGLAGTAAHASERTAAPISCWLAARAGSSLADASNLARQLAMDISSDR
ncbi:MAG: DUF6457 domain-containing protein [Acidimicrobiales bacterium]|jgi:hypothetical protein